MRHAFIFHKIDAIHMIQTAYQQTRSIGPTRRSVSGIYVFRGERAVAFESTLERDFLVRKEFANNVLDVIPQPCQITYRHPATGREQVYTPDFLVHYHLGDRHYDDYPKPELVEVKPQAQWRKHWREWLPKWKAARRWAHEQGMVFHIVDETRIRTPALANIQFLSRYRRMRFSPQETAVVLSTLRDMGSTTIDFLLARHFMGLYRAQGIAHIWHLLATRQIDCDIAKPLSDFTEVWIPQIPMPTYE